eukprot:c16899_g1_i1 orf=2-400(-)
MAFLTTLPADHHKMIGGMSSSSSPLPPILSSSGEFKRSLVPLAVASCCAATANSFGSSCGGRYPHSTGHGFGVRLGGIREASCFSFSTHFHCSAVLGYFGRVDCSVSERESLKRTVALMSSMGGGFWEGADSE